MITFKSPEDLSKLSASHPAYPLIKELIELLIVAYTTPERPYEPDDDGYIILIGLSDIDAVIPDLGCKLIDVFWEGAFKRDGMYCGIYLGSDQYGLSIVIPDLPWVKGDLRKLLDELVGY